MEEMFNELIISHHSVEIYEILIIQGTEGELLSIKIDEYETERTKTPESFRDDEVIH